MAIISCELEKRLNGVGELRDLSFGTELKKCFESITGGSVGNTVLSVYASTAAYEAANTAQDGSFFVDSTTNTLNYYVNGMWVEVDLLTVQAAVTANATQISLNQTEIANVAAQLAAHILDFAAHTHDGVNSPLIEIEGQLAAAGTAGQFLTVSAGGVVEFTTIDTSLEVQSLGTTVETTATTLNFADNCFVVNTVSGVVSITIPDLKTAITDIASNVAAITANSSSIAGINTLLATNTAAIAANTLTGATNASAIQSHDHTGGTSGVQLDPTVSTLSTGIANGFLLGSDGAGNVVWIDSSTLTTSTTIVGQSIGAGTATDIFKQVNGLGEIEIRDIEGSCGIVTSLDATDDHIIVELDFAGMTNAGTALDPVNDTIIIHDASTGECVQTSIEDLLSVPVSVSRLDGTGGTIVTDSADIISGAQGAVANVGVLQFQNAAGTVPYFQIINDQWRITDAIRTMRITTSITNLTSTGNATAHTNVVSMGVTGQVAELPGNSYQGYTGEIVKNGGECFKVSATLGGSLLGYINGVELAFDGESLDFHQIDANNYKVNVNWIPHRLRSTFSGGFNQALNPSSWTTINYDDLASDSNVGLYPATTNTYLVERATNIDVSWRVMLNDTISWVPNATFQTRVEVLDSAGTVVGRYYGDIERNDSANNYLGPFASQGSAQVFVPKGGGIRVQGRHTAASGQLVYNSTDAFENTYIMFHEVI